MARQPNPNRHKGNYKSGDRVVFINIGPFTGKKGMVLYKTGFFTKKYVVQLENGKRTPPVSERFLTRSKT